MRPKNLPEHLHWPTDEEEAAIQRGIAQDPDSPEWTEADFRAARPAAEVMPHLLAQLTPPRRRGPQRQPRKRLVSLRLDAEVIERLRAEGPGWQVRANALLRRALLGE